jgi:hypothetical protein
MVNFPDSTYWRCRWHGSATPRGVTVTGGDVVCCVVPLPPLPLGLTLSLLLVACVP